jgi:hypothetical protein
MSRRAMHHWLIGLALTAVSLLGVLYQVNESMADDGSADGSVPRLICPLH